jgi:hypothetical protein
MGVPLNRPPHPATVVTPRTPHAASSPPQQNGGATPVQRHHAPFGCPSRQPPHPATVLPQIPVASTSAAPARAALQPHLAREHRQVVGLAPHFVIPSRMAPIQCSQVPSSSASSSSSFGSSPSEDASSPSSTDESLEERKLAPSAVPSQPECSLKGKKLLILYTLATDAGKAKRAAKDLKPPASVHHVCVCKSKQGGGNYDIDPKTYEWVRGESAADNPIPSCPDHLVRALHRRWCPAQVVACFGNANTESVQVTVRHTSSDDAEALSKDHCVCGAVFAAVAHHGAFTAALAKLSFSISSTIALFGSALTLRTSTPEV